MTGSTENLHVHHIFSGTANRKISDENGFWVYLTGYWHNQSNNGVHFNRKLDLHLKKLCQKKYEESHSRNDFMKLVGRNYLE